MEGASARATERACEIVGTSEQEIVLDREGEKAASARGRMWERAEHRAEQERSSRPWEFQMKLACSSLASLSSRSSPFFRRSRWALIHTCRSLATTPDPLPTPRGPSPALDESERTRASMDRASGERASADHSQKDNMKQKGFLTTWSTQGFFSLWPWVCAPQLLGIGGGGR